MSADRNLLLYAVSATTITILSSLTYCYGSNVRMLGPLDYLVWYYTTGYYDSICSMLGNMLLKLSSQ